jgi:hypothetical protein
VAGVLVPVAAVIAGAVVYLAGAAFRVLADISVTPTGGMPGEALLKQMLGWLDTLALWGSVASILVGAAIYGIAQNMGNYANGYRGKQLAVAGVVGACLAGLAPTAVNMLYTAAGGKF